MNKNLSPAKQQSKRQRALNLLHKALRTRQADKSQSPLVQQKIVNLTRMIADTEAAIVRNR